jgi:hypothetical protein
MPCHLLEDSIASLQREYGSLLSALLPGLGLQNVISSLDEINIFWHSNMDLAMLYLNYVIAHDDSYVFTTATSMDADEGEQYSFMLLGRAHILDDPLGAYSASIAQGIPSTLADVLKRTIASTAADNIRILEECGGKIVVLPFRLLSHEQEELSPALYKAGKQAFVSLFDDISSVDDFFAKCESLEDIEKHLKHNMENMILFTEHDDGTEPFTDRFRDAVREHASMYETGSSEAAKFFQTVYGYIQQSVDVLASCLQYNCTPHMRSRISLLYFMLLSESFMEVPTVPSMRYKACVGHLISCLCNTEKLSTVVFEHYCRLVLETKFQDLLFSSLAEAGITEHNFSPNKIAPILNKRLDELYAAL